MTSRLEEILESLGALASQHSNEPKSEATIKVAAKALHFIRSLGKLEDFWAYESAFGTAESSPEPLRTFANQADAGAWLRTQSDIPYAAVVKVADSLYSVARTPEGGWTLVRVPSVEELDG